MPNELAVRSGRGGRRPAPEVQIEVVRALTEADLGELNSPSQLGSAPPTVSSLRASHHQLAQLLAQGFKPADAALATGYSTSRISILSVDPAFQELLEHYKTVRELAFADVLERARVLGLSTLDELQSRLETETSGWTKRELMELADLLLVKMRSGPEASGSGGSPGGVVVNVKFVGSERPLGPVIDGDPPQ